MKLQGRSPDSTREMGRVSVFLMKAKALSTLILTIMERALGIIEAGSQLLKRESQPERPTVHNNTATHDGQLSVTPVFQHGPNLLTRVSHVGHPYNQLGPNYSISLSRQIKTGMNRQFLKGLSTGKLPFGYESVPEYRQNGPHRAATLLGFKAQVSSAHAAIVRQAFRMYADGETVFAIIRMMNQTCVPHRTWTRNAIIRLLANPIYIGQCKRNITEKSVDPRSGKPVVHPTSISEWLIRHDEHLRVVDQDTWERVRSRHERETVHRARRHRLRF